MMDLVPDIDVFVANNTIIDIPLYELWLQSYQPIEVVNLKKKQLKDVPPEFIMSDVLDQYRTLGLMEKYLKNPSTLGNQLTFQMSPDMQYELIVRYFSFDDKVIRELLGKKLSRSTYQSMNEIADKTSVNHRSCLRQFDNCRSVYKAVEDMPGSLVDNISQSFLLPIELSWAYATVVFLSSHKFECTKRKLSHMSLNNFIICVKHLSEHWTSSSDVEQPNRDASTEIDREFLHDLRGAKFLSSDKDVIERMRQFCVSKSKDDCTQLSRLLCRGISGIGSSLYHTKDLRDFFVDIVEKIIEPVRTGRWNNSMLHDFLTYYAKVTDEHSQMISCKSAWSRFMNALICCAAEAFY